MNTDIRVRTTFPHHHKTKKLRRKLGAEGVCALVFIWLFAAENRPDGVLSGMDEEDIAIAAQWDGDASSMLVAMLDVGFLDKNAKGDYLIHDWATNNAWAASAPARSEKASKAAKARWDRKNGVQEPDIDAKSLQGIAPSIKENAPSNAPSPNPIPSPSPNPIPSPSPNPIPSPSLNNNDVGREGADPLEEILAAYNRLCPSLVPAMDMAIGMRYTLAKKACARFASQDGGVLGFIETLCQRAEASDLITNRNGKWRSLPCGIDWLLDENNYIRVLEGFYDNGKNRPAASSGSGASRREIPPAFTDRSTDDFCNRE